MTRVSGDFDADGFAVARDLVSVEDSRRYLAAALGVAGASEGDFNNPGHLSPRAFYRHGALADTAGLWDLLTHDGIVATLREVLGDPLVCLPGIDTLGIHYSETDAHRDASPHELPSYCNDGAGYRLARVILYPGAAQARLRVLPGSHRQPGRVADLLTGSSTAWRWLTFGPTDIVLFDPRIIHAGGGVQGPRAMLIATYGVDGPLTAETYFHARLRTSTLGFRDPRAPFVDHLRRHNLMLEAAMKPAEWDAYRRLWPDPAH